MPLSLPFTKSIPGDSRWRHFPRLAGLLVVFLGGLILTSWYAHWQKILQLIPDTAPMQYNAALCFILLGTGLFLLTTRHARLAPWPGGAAGLVAGVTLVEYLTGQNLGLDLLFFKPYFEFATAYPGRMSPLAAICFLGLSAGLISIGSRPRASRALAVTAALCCVAGVISWVVLCGYIFGIESAYGWGAYSRMAANTAGALFLYSAGLFTWVWLLARAEYRLHLRWLPATGSVTLIVMVALIVSSNQRELNQATYWRQHTVEVILSAQSYLETLLDLQRGMRGYVMLGDTNALAAYRSSVDLEPAQSGRLAALTEDNPAQQERLHKLSAAFNDLLAYDEQLIAAYRDQGLAGASRLDATGESRLRFGRVRDALGAFSQEERQLLAARGAAEGADSTKTTRLLVFGCVLASGLLLLGNFMASREMRLRRRVEARLTAALALQDAILASANYAIVAMDRHGVVTSFNAAAEKMLGYHAAEVIEKATPHWWTEAKPTGGSPKKLGMESCLALAGMPGLGEYETTLVRKGGQRIPVLVSTTALTDAGGNLTGFLAVIGDRQERKGLKPQLSL